MQEAALAQAADELYGLPPASFREARDEQAARARAAGDRELAAAIRKLRRPTVSAWLVNRLVREAAGQVDELLELGEALREAQSVLAGDRLRELSGRRRQLVSALTREARRLAGQDEQPVSDQTERELMATLEAALADPEAAAAVRTGRLASALSYAGLGGPDVASAVAVPGVSPAGRAQPGAGRPGGGRPGAGGQRGRQREARAAEAARRELAEAEAAVRDAEHALAGAEQETDSATGRHLAVQQRIAELEQQLREGQAEEARTARAAGQARRDRDAAARSLATAQRRLASIRERGDLPG